jgi:nucleoside-diphosphate-sugar epimerase
MGITAKGIVRRPEAAGLVEELGGEAIIIKGFDKEALIQAFKGCDGVLHLIGIVNEQYSTFQEVNVKGTKIVLESAYESQASMFVTPSGLGVDQYGKKPWATNEYFASKRQIEQMCQASPMPHIIFRPSYILGPGDELIPNLVNAILEGTVLVAGEGNTPMQPIFVDDATTVFLRAATGFGKKNTIYDLVGPETTTFMQLIPRVANIMRGERFTIPIYEIMNIPLEDAARVLELSKEEIDVMLCDVLGDPMPVIRDFQIPLTPLERAIHAAVQAVEKERIQ